MKVFMRYFEGQPDQILSETTETDCVWIVKGKKIQLEGEEDYLLDVFDGNCVFYDVTDVEVI